MAAKQIIFSTIDTAEALAKVLAADINALYCTDVVKHTTLWGGEASIYRALIRNGQGGRSAGPPCSVHRQSWFPRKGECGSLLLGHEFLRPEDPSGRKTCACVNKTCTSIGYSRSYVSIPWSKQIQENFSKQLPRVSTHQVMNTRFFVRDSLTAKST
jgi:hypothetical protein